MTTPNGEGAQSGAEGTQSGAGENTGANGSTESSTTAGTQSGTETATQTPAETIPKAEADALRERMKAADRRAAELDAQLRQLRDKDLPEADKLKRDFEESQKQVETLQNTNRQLALQVAFLKDNTYTWHNPETALKLVDLTQVSIEEDGSVNGLKDALKALATSNDYLIKKEVNKEEPKPPAGTAPANNGGSNGKPSTKGMAARIPALSTRVRRS